MEHNDHALTVVEWAELLLLDQPKTYRERPEPPCTIVFPGPKKIRLLRRRYRRKLALFSPLDLQANALERVGPEATRARNGQDVMGVTRISGGAGHSHA